MELLGTKHTFINDKLAIRGAIVKRKRELTVVIAEDQAFDREHLEFLAGQLDLKVVGSSGSGDWFIDDCIKYEPDLVFLDIGLQGTDGISAYKKLLEKGLSPYLIIVSGTNSQSLVLAGLAINCIDFVMKPITIDRLSEAVRKAENVLEKDLVFSNTVPGKILELKSNYKTVFINENKLIYAKKVKDEHKTTLFIEGEKDTGIKINGSIGSIQEQCSDFIFTPNPSELVNFNYIHSVFASDRFFGSYVIKLTHNNIEIKLSRRKRKEFESLFAAFNEKLTYNTQKK